MIWDAEDLLESRVAAMREVPWPIPALVIMQMTDKDLAHLDVAADSPEYPSVLSEIVSRIQKGKQHE